MKATLSTAPGIKAQHSLVHHSTSHSLFSNLTVHTIAFCHGPFVKLLWMLATTGLKVKTGVHKLFIKHWFELVSLNVAKKKIRTVPYSQCCIGKYVFEK